MTLFGRPTVPPGNPSSVKQSAEERLLQVIQEGGESSAQGRRKLFGGFYQKIRSALKPGRGSSGEKPTRGFDLARLNKLLGVLILLGLSLTVGGVFFYKPDISRMHGRVAVAGSTAQAHSAFNPVSVEELLSQVGSRSLFQPKTKEAAPAAVPSPAEQIQGVMDDLQLVGIAWGAQPEAMIREKKEGRTFFLKTGDQLKGVVVKEILKDKVIVEYGGQTKELM